ncbi:glucosaminidase domain-containing protein [Carnobacterium gallinarum]|uniref:glucosaminidase domain-containing protein n=1 Tax=Carnobacterium gallinarum TaxID=2749 RepID=UPI000692481E|nr:glucosaminidase domain-containing protein [Carnobacterium gallinarum]
MSKVVNFLAEIKAGAILGWHQYKILPSITASQAALESAWGTSQLSLAPNYNLFGIKGSYNGASVEFPTWEVINGQNVTVQATFRKYPNWATSVTDHGRFFHENSRYSGVLGLTDFVQQARAIKAAGYATDPLYADKLIATIEANNLASWDNEVLSNQGSASTPTNTTYIVQSGDNLSSIAQQFGTTVAALIAENSLANPNLIHPGQVIQLNRSTGSRIYLVKSGDVLSVVAKKLGVPMDVLIQKNKIQNANLIYPGQQLNY